jgi:hypothetical protein
MLSAMLPDEVAASPILRQQWLDRGCIAHI